MRNRFFPLKSREVDFLRQLLDLAGGLEAVAPLRLQPRRLRAFVFREKAETKNAPLRSSRSTKLHQITRYL